MPSLYHQCGDHFEPTEYARSPWHPGLLHGASVAALFGFHLARWGHEHADLRMTRLSLDLLRPVPMAPLAMRQTVLRDGRDALVSYAWYTISSGAQASRAGSPRRPKQGRLTQIRTMQNQMTTISPLFSNTRL